MIDYLEDLVEEEPAVELTGTLLVPVGRRKPFAWEAEEESLRHRAVPTEPAPGNGAVPEEQAAGNGSGKSFWAEEGEVLRSGSAGLLAQLVRAVGMAGRVRRQAPLTVTLTGEEPRAGGVDLDAIDRAVQRDARRYDGGFSLY